MAYKNKEEQREFVRKHWLKNKERYSLARKERYKEKVLYLRKIKDVPCTDCGNKYPYFVMDLDHKEGTEKEERISVLVNCSWEKFLKEIEKCDVVCSNCHRIRTFTRGQNYCGLV